MKKNLVLLLSLLLVINLPARDLLIEVKSALFLPTNANFKNIYSKKGGIYGLELTGELGNHWYGFMSADFFKKHGYTVDFNSPTKVKITNLGIGLKYFLPFSNGDLYFGLGVLPTHLHTIDSSEFVPASHAKWSCGGLVKFGLILDIAEHLFVDLFCDYDFAQVNFKFIPNQPTQLHNARLNSFWLGLGVGWRL